MKSWDKKYQKRSFSLSSDYSMFNDDGQKKTSMLDILYVFAFILKMST